jgi:Ni/Co efflux regulator RcnB
MNARWWIRLSFASLLLLPAGAARAQDRDQEGEHDRDKHDKDKHDRDDRNSHERYDDHDREAMRKWYDDHEHGHGRGQGLPPGLAKRDQLPPGLERQLVVRGELPPGLRKKIQRCPEELERRLPPPPRDCEHVVIGGHIVLLNRKTFVVLDIFHVEVR